MKKSQTIHLVLITAALASCDRVIIPGQSAGGKDPDPSLTTAPVEEDSVYDCTCQLNSNNYNWYNPYRSYNNPSVDFDFYYSGQPYNVPYQAGPRYRINTTFRNHVVVVHGGFGKAASAGSSGGHGGSSAAS
jgi:hypothetical protein